MLFQKNKAIGTGWMALRVNGKVVKGQTHGGKVSRKTTKVIRYGSDEAEAETDGVVEADPTVIEFDMMGSNTIAEAFGIVDGNSAIVKLSGQKFEIVESVRDPDTSASSAGGWTSTGKGCRVTGVEWKHAIGEAPSTMNWTISILNWTIAAGDKGGGGFKI
jgi:hypothetical protein